MNVSYSYLYNKGWVEFVRHVPTCWDIECTVNEISELENVFVYTDSPLCVVQGSSNTVSMKSIGVFQLVE